MDETEVITITKGRIDREHKDAKKQVRNIVFNRTRVGGRTPKVTFRDWFIRINEERGTYTLVLPYALEGGETGTYTVGL